MSSRFLLCCIIMLLLSSSSEALSFRAGPESGSRSFLKRVDSELPSKDRIKKAIQRSHLRARMLAPSRSSSIANLDIRFSSGDYLMPVEIGTPPQQFHVVFDTGSDFFWVQYGMPNQEDYFDDSSSSSFLQLSCNSSQCIQFDPRDACADGRDACRYEYTYGSGETSGFLGVDVLSLPSSDGRTRQFPVVFGCGDVNRGFSDSMDGIAGFGRGPMSLTTQLSSGIGGRFSYCLRSDVGRCPLNFGAAANIHASIQQTHTIPLLTDRDNPSMYILGLTAVSVDGERTEITNDIILESGPVAIDCGTTLTYLPDPVYNAVKSFFTSKISLDPADAAAYQMDLCYNMGSEIDYKFPSLTLHFHNDQLIPPQENYFFQPDPDVNPGVVCLAIMSSSVAGINIIGNLMQQNYQILYDTAGSRLSFAPSDCAKLQL